MTGGGGFASSARGDSTIMSEICAAAGGQAEPFFELIPQQGPRRTPLSIRAIACRRAFKRLEKQGEFPGALSNPIRP
jgi:hypothetical protein